eukprot:GHVL01005209.1.p2 GENE.GHVL01005209.1~~GHVL01005209.1.p2  ORF type:complete len:206 (-),score=34.24 GHVL01005209.1:30-647(-)
MMEKNDYPPLFSDLLRKISFQSMVVTHICFNNKELPYALKFTPSFWIPKGYKKMISGVIINSNIAPKDKNDKNRLMLTVYTLVQDLSQRSIDQIEETAVSETEMFMKQRSLMNFDLKFPDLVYSEFCENSISAPCVGAESILENIHKTKYPWLEIVGAGYHAYNAIQCVGDSRIAMHFLAERLSKFPQLYKTDDWKYRGSFPITG